MLNNFDDLPETLHMLQSRYFEAKKAENAAKLEAKQLKKAIQALNALVPKPAIERKPVRPKKAPKTAYNGAFGLVTCESD